MSNGRIRQSRLPDIIAQFGQIDPVGGGLKASTEGVLMAQKFRENEQKRQAAKLELEKAKLEMAAKKERERSEKERQSKIKEFSKLLGKPKGSQIETGVQVAPEATGTALFGPPPGQEGPAQQLPVAAPVPETMGREERLTELAAQLQPEKSVEKFLTGEKPISTKEQLQINKLQLEQATEGPEVDSLKKLLSKRGFSEAELVGATKASLEKLANLESRQTVAKAREDMATVMSNRLTEQKARTTLTSINKLGARLNPGTSTAQGMKENFRRLTGASRVAVLGQKLKGDLTPQEYRESVTAVASLIQGGSAGRIAKEQIDELSVDTFNMRFANAKQFILNNPQDAKVKAFVERLIGLSLREALEAEQTVRQAQINEILANREVLEKRNPEAFDQMAKALGIDLSKIEKGHAEEIMDEPDYRSILPLFNPITLDPQKVISGEQPLTVDMLIPSTLIENNNALNNDVEVIETGDELDDFEIIGIEE